MSCLRRSDSCWTLSPRYSVSTALFAVPNRSFRASTLSTFS